MVLGSFLSKVSLPSIIERRKPESPLSDPSHVSSVFVKLDEALKSVLFVARSDCPTGNCKIS